MVRVGAESGSIDCVEVGLLQYGQSRDFVFTYKPNKKIEDCSFTINLETAEDKVTSVIEGVRSSDPSEINAHFARCKCTEMLNTGMEAYLACPAKSVRGFCQSNRKDNIIPAFQKTT